MNQKELEEYIYQLMNKAEILNVQVMGFQIDAGRAHLSQSTRIEFMATLKRGGIAKFTVETDSLALNSGIRAAVLTDKIKKKKKEKAETIDFKKELKGI